MILPNGEQPVPARSPARDALCAALPYARRRERVGSCAFIDVQVRCFYDEPMVDSEP
jgi:hypothetical protein